jgi:hypothetical protein
MENTKITFLLPEDVTIVDVISEILKNNGLEETTSEILKKISEKQTPKLIIVRDAALSLAGKKASENDLISLLQKQLAITEIVAQKIVGGINQKLMPFAKMITFNKEDTKVVPKVSGEKDSFTSFVKKPEFLNVEENEKTINKQSVPRPVPKKEFNIEKKSVRKTKAEKISENPTEVDSIPKITKRSGPDSYRESIQ